MTMNEATYSIPPELLCQPRRVRLARPALHALFAFGLLITAIMAIVGSWTLSELVGNIGLVLGGTNVTARAIAVKAHPKTRLGLTYSVDYEFDLDGVQSRGNTYISHPEVARLRNEGLGPDASNGQPAGRGQVTIQMRTWNLGPFRWNMSSSEFAGDSAYIAMPAGCSVMFVPAGFGGFFGLVYYWLRLRRLFKMGLPARGVVISKKKSFNGRITTYDIKYAFQTPDGERHEGVEGVSRCAFDEVNEGQTVTVLHFEGKSKPSVIYEYGGFKCE
ncbi:MAG: hypothetical protein NTW19_25345 [Planctomycetota bacterium]|nr:hypothetical protein [Planctomycetota bacterium]